MHRETLAIKAPAVKLAFALARLDVRSCGNRLRVYGRGEVREVLRLVALQAQMGRLISFLADGVQVETSVPETGLLVQKNDKCMIECRVLSSN